MPYTRYTPEERETLQVMEALRRLRWNTAVIMGKHQSGVYRELNWNAQAGLYAAAHARKRAEQRRHETKPCPKIDNISPMEAVKKRFKEDWSPERIAGRLAMEKAGKTLSHETIYRYLYRELKREPALRAHFRHPGRKRASRTGRRTFGDRFLTG